MVGLATRMDQMFDLVEGVQLEPIALLDIVLTAVLIYGAFSLIQGTRAVRLIVGAILLYLLYVMAQALDLRLLSGIMQLGAVVGLFALVVVFQPELRRGLDRLGRVGSLGWLGPSGSRGAGRVAGVLASSARRCRPRASAPSSSSSARPHSATWPSRASRSTAASRRSC